MDTQIKSKERIKNHGEVFTNQREVNNMLDLVKQETERLDSRFLEPACGDGNFLYEILKRKLEVAKRLSKKDVYLYKKNSIIAISSIYGVELLLDNTIECRNRLYNYAYLEYKKLNEKDDDLYINSIKYLIDTNIICGDALTLLDNTGEPLTFAEWGFHDDYVTRRDFTLSTILAAESLNIPREEEVNIFNYDENLLQELVESVNIPKKTYKDVHFLKIGEAYNE